MGPLDQRRTRLWLLSQSIQDVAIYIVTKEVCHTAGLSTFAGTGVNVTSDGRPSLGAAVGSADRVRCEAEG